MGQLIIFTKVPLAREKTTHFSRASALRKRTKSERFTSIQK